MRELSLKNYKTKILVMFFFTISVTSIVFALFLSVFTNVSKQTPEEQSYCVGIANPAAVYCKFLGYDYEIVKTEQGDIGYCVFPDGSKCEEWSFYAGKCGVKYSYCNINGYETMTLSDGRDLFSREYTACVMPDKASIPASELMSLSEKMSQCAIKTPRVSEREQIVKASPVGSLPASFSWRNYYGYDWTTPVKNQGSCGSCWAFSAVGVVESSFKLYWYGNPDRNPDLSEENLVSDCLPGNSCCGGYHVSALEYIRGNGITEESCFPYVDSDCSCPYDICRCTYRSEGSCSNAKCSDNMCENNPWRWQIEGYGKVPSDSTSIKNYLFKYGPLSAAMGVGSSAGSYWDGDIYRCTDDAKVNHAVVIVGYDDTGGYWIVRNSWGPYWNGDGHFKVGYGECSIEKYVYYAYGPFRSQTAYLVVRGSDNKIYWRSHMILWNNWHKIDIGSASEGVAAAYCDPYLYFVVRGFSPENSLWFSYIDVHSGNFSGWTRIPGSTPSKPALAIDPNNCEDLYLVVRGMDNGIWLNIFEGYHLKRKWLGWRRLPGTTPDSPAIAILFNEVSEMELHIVVRGFSPENSIYHGVYNIDTGAFSGWRMISGSTPSSPALATIYDSNIEDRLLLAVRGMDNRIYLRNWLREGSWGEWLDWLRIPTGTTLDAPAITVAGDVAHIVVRGSSVPSEMYHCTKNLRTGTLSSWIKLSGSTLSSPTLTTETQDLIMREGSIDNT
ncbi:MAG: C1 family peptidase [Nitrososphaerota archaeon]